MFSYRLLRDMKPFRLFCNNRCKVRRNFMRFPNTRMSYSTCPGGMKVTICGAAGATGQPLALLLKQCQLLDEISLYDISATCGYGMELSHVDTKCKVSSFSGRHLLCDALKDSKVVIIVARNEIDSFENNSPIVTEIALQICNVCPTVKPRAFAASNNTVASLIGKRLKRLCNECDHSVDGFLGIAFELGVLVLRREHWEKWIYVAFTIVATEPVESMVPIIGEIQRLRSLYNPRMLLGCVELNCVRANTVLADFLSVPPESVRVPVIGGATPNTMVPVISTAVHPGKMSQEQLECITSCIMGGNEAVCATKGCCTETASLAGAYAIARTTINVVKGLQGQKNVVQCAYVDSLGTCAPDCQYFASEVVLGPSGIEQNLGVPELTKFENCLLINCLPYIRNEIARAIWLVYMMCQQCCCATCPVHPDTCFAAPIVPCVPPVNWTCDRPDSCRDEYLASICRKMTCTWGNMELVWRPRDTDYDAVRAAKLAHQMPLKGMSCAIYQVPRSLRLQEQMRRSREQSEPCL